MTTQTEISMSSINEFLDCPLRYRLHHIEGVKPAWQVPLALHHETIRQLIYLMHDSKWNMNVRHYYRDIFDYFELYRDGENRIPLLWMDREKTLEEFEVAAARILEDYRWRRENREARALYSRQRIRVEMEDFMLAGTIDLVRENPDGTIELVIFIPGEDPFPTARLHNDWQLNLMTHVLSYGEIKVGDEWVKPALIPDFSSWYFLGADNEGENSGCLVRSEKDEMELEVFRKKFIPLLAAMTNGHYYANPKQCHACAHTYHCMERQALLPMDLLHESGITLSRMTR